MSKLISTSERIVEEIDREGSTDVFYMMKDVGSQLAKRIGGDEVCRHRDEALLGFVAGFLEGKESRLGKQIIEISDDDPEVEVRYEALKAMSKDLRVYSKEIYEGLVNKLCLITAHMNWQ